MATIEAQDGFIPDYAVPPGETLIEWLEEKRMTQAELARRIDLSPKTLNQIIRGHAPLSQTTALRLETVTGIPARTWNSLEALYQEDKARLAAQTQFAAQTDFLKEMPVTQLRKLGIIKAPARDKVSLMREILMFFGVADVDAWRQLWQSPQAAFRRSAAFSSKPGAVAAWLRLGELAAEEVKTAPYDHRGLRNVLAEIRQLTTEPDPAVFVPSLSARLAEVGVVMVFVPEISGSRCSGAARWIGRRPVIQLSLRHRSDDHLWFSLFHEIGHVLLHPRTDVFIDDGQTSNNELRLKEDEANQFASDLLIPTAYDLQLPNLRTLDSIRSFAQQLGISPGIVVGRLQRDKVIGYHVGNGLKKRYSFADPE